jgi:hypothetical protein
MKARINKRIFTFTNSDVYRVEREGTRAVGEGDRKHEDELVTPKGAKRSITQARLGGEKNFKGSCLL